MIKKLKKLFKTEKRDYNINKNRRNEVENKIENLYNSLEDYSIKVHAGDDLCNFASDIIDFIDDFRNKIKKEYGFIFPAIKIYSDDIIQENMFILKINNKTIIEKYVIPKKEDVIANFKEALEKIFFEHIEEIFTCEIMEKYIQKVKQTNNYLICNLTYLYTIVELKNIMIYLLKQKKSINNISFIMEEIGEIVLSSGYYRLDNTQKIAEKVAKLL